LKHNKNVPGKLIFNPKSDYKFYKNLISRFLSLAINQISAILLIFLMTVRLEIQEFGHVASALILYQIIYIFIEWGFPIYVIKFEKFLSKGKFNKQIVTIHYAKIFFFIFATLILSLLYFKNLILFENNNLFISLIFLNLTSILNPLWFFQYHNNTQKLLWPIFFSKLLQFFIIYNFLHNENSYLVLFSQALSFFIVSMWGYFFIIKKYNFLIKVNFNEVINTISLSKGIFINNLNQNFSYSLWGGYLVFFGSYVQLAIFNLGDTLLRAGNSFSTILPEVLITNFKHNLRKKTIIIVILFLFLISFFFIFYLENFLLLLSKNEFINNLVFFQITIFSWLLISLTKLFGYPLLGQKKGFNFVNKISYNIILLHVISSFSYFILFDQINLLAISIICLSIHFIHLTFLLFYLKK